MFVKIEIISVEVAMRRFLLSKVLSGVLAVSLLTSTTALNAAAYEGDNIYIDAVTEADESVDNIDINADDTVSDNSIDDSEIIISEDADENTEDSNVSVEEASVESSSDDEADDTDALVSSDNNLYDETGAPVYPENFGILDMPEYGLEVYGPVVSDYDESFGGDGREITYGYDGNEDDIIIEDDGADSNTASNKVNIKNYKISISSKKSTNRKPANTYAARTPNVITFFDYLGRLNVAYANGQNAVTVQVYEPSTMKLFATKKLTIPYKLFGSITCDDKGNYYVVSGQNAYKDGSDSSQDLEKVSICISKYDYDGKKVAELLVKGKNSNPYSGDDWGTCEPFHAGNCSITVNNGIVAVNYGRRMFNGHQSNMIIYARCSDMTRVYANTAYTSHSFDQRIYPDGDGFLALNHGDAYDRSFQITKIAQFQDDEGYWLPAVDDYPNFHFREGANRDHGYNETFAQLGGMAQLDGAYAFAGASERKLSLEPGPTSTYMGHNDARDLFVQILKKDFENYEGAEKYLVAGETRRPEGTRPKKSATELFLKGSEANYGVIWLTKYDKNSYAANPKVFALTSDIFGVLWEKRSYEGDGAETYFLMMRTNGTKVRDARKIDGCLLAADVDPVVKNGNIYWTTNDGNGAVVHVLNPSNISIKKQPYIKSVTTNTDGSKSPVLTIEADGAVSYQWQKSSDGKNWSPVSTKEAEGADTSTLTIKTISADYYRCLMVDDIGYKAYSDVAFGFVQNTDNVYAEVNTGAELKVQALGAAEYKWMYSTDGSKWKDLSDSDVSGANTSKVTIPMTEARFSYKYRCVITGLSGKTLNSEAVKIRHILKITREPEDIFGELGKSYTATIEASGDGVSYTWYMIDDNTGSRVNISYKGYKTNTLTVKLDEKTENRLFVCVVKDTYGTELESKQIIVAQTRGITAVPKKLTLVSKKDSKGTISIIQTGVKYDENTLIWKSSDISAATVNKGTVTAVEGLTESKTVEITITTPDKLYTDTCVVTVNPIPTASAPESTLPEGQYTQGSKLLLSSKTVGARIYYTTNGTTPAFDGKGAPTGDTRLFDEAIVLTGDMNLRAVAVKDNYKNSEVAEYDYTIKADWGDIDSDKLRLKIGGVQNVPEGVWYVFGSDTYGYSEVYTGSAALEYGHSYTGSAITFDEEIRVFHGTDRLWQNRDYKLSYKNNVKCSSENAAKAPTVTITGMGNYSKKAVFTFVIGEEYMMSLLLQSESEVAVAAGTRLGTVKPVLISKYKKLTFGKDYVAEYYKDSVAPANLISNPAKEAVEASSTYYIRLKAAEKSGYKGNYPEDVTVIGINDKDDKSASMSKVKVSVPKIPYTGKSISAVALFDNREGKNAVARVEYAGRTLIYEKDFEAQDFDMLTAGEYYVTLLGCINNDGSTSFFGQKVVKVEVQGIPASKVKVAGLAGSCQYLGRALSIDDLYKADKSSFDKVTLYTANAGTTTELKYGEDYFVSIHGDGSKGKLTVEFTLEGQYSGSIKKTVNVTSYDLGKDTGKLVKAKAEDAVFTKSGAEAEVTLSFDGKELREGIDYTVSYKNNKLAGGSGKKAPVAVIKGKGNFAGSKTVSFTIKKADVSNLEVTCKDVVYKEKAGAFKAKAQITEGGAALVIGKNKDIEPIAASDYSYFLAETGEELDDKAKVAAGTLIEVRAKVTISASSNYEAGNYVIRGYYRVIAADKDISKAQVKVDTKNLAYDRGNDIIPVKKENLTVTLKKNVLKSSDYEIISVKGNRYLGTATVKIRGTGEYGGVKTFTFKIGARALK